MRHDIENIRHHLDWLDSRWRCGDLEDVSSSGFEAIEHLSGHPFVINASVFPGDTLLDTIYGCHGFPVPECNGDVEKYLKKMQGAGVEPRGYLQAHFSFGRKWREAQATRGIADHLRPAMLAFDQGEPDFFFPGQLIAFKGHVFFVLDRL
jgi:hypothetical protein